MDRDELNEFYEKRGNAVASDQEGINSFEDLKREFERIRKSKFVYTSTKCDGAFDIGLGNAVFKRCKCVEATGIAHNSVRDDRKLFDTELLHFEKAARKIIRRLDYAE